MAIVRNIDVTAQSEVASMMRVVWRLLRQQKFSVASCRSVSISPSAWWSTTGSSPTKSRAKSCFKLNDSSASHSPFIRIQ